ncbi:MAG: M48 family metalloprotease [Acidobacteria bacterium]|nr:M48 family metalloprotease [Acidobacteriota bacterium]
MKAKLIFPTIIILTLIAPACSSGGGFNLISLEEEWQLGRQLEADIARQMTINRDPTVNQYVNRLGQAIVSKTSMAQLPWNFHVVQSDEINAFNIPGGHVYVTTGLINAADQANELAGVMAHEIAHGVERHATEQMSRAYGLNILASIVLGQDPATYQAILAQIVGTGALASFSRDAERQSDDLAVNWMTAAGYHPSGMVSMFETLIQNRRGSPGAVDKFFSTHPVTENRIADVNEQISRMSLPSNLIRDEQAYQAVRARV